MKKLLSIWLLISFFSFSGASLSTLKEKTTDVINIIGKGTYTCLLCGYDDAASNTDSIILASYNSVDNAISFLQIPRDTYFNFGGSQNKINQIVPSKVSSGSSLGESLSFLTGSISEALSVNIDGYVGFSISSVENLIDTLGGIDINVPFDVKGQDTEGNTVEIKSGQRHLSGKEAMVLIRHRSSYPLGDLSRIDMQKLFLSSAFSSFVSSMDLDLAVKLLTLRDDGIVFNADLIELLTFAVKNLGRIKKATAKFATLPGVALANKRKLSYYCFNKNATQTILDDLGFIRFGTIDPYAKFLNNDEELFTEAYYSNKIIYTVYSSEDLKNIKFIIH